MLAGRRGQLLPGVCEGSFRKAIRDKRKIKDRACPFALQSQTAHLLTAIWGGYIGQALLQVLGSFFSAQAQAEALPGEHS